MTRVTQMSRPLLRPRVGYGNPAPPTQEVASCNHPGSIAHSINVGPARPVGKSFLDGDGKLSPIRSAVGKPLTVRGIEYLHAARIVPSSVTFEPTMPTLASYNKPGFVYSALIQVSEPVSLTDTSEKKMCKGLPSAVPRCSVEISKGPAFL